MTNLREFLCVQKTKMLKVGLEMAQRTDVHDLQMGAQWSKPFPKNDKIGLRIHNYSFNYP